MRLISFSLLFLLQSYISVAQSADSVAFAHMQWDSKRLASGIHVKQAKFRGYSLFKANQVISVVEVKPRSKNKFTIAYEVKQKRTTSEFGTTNHALAALNGTFFDVAHGGSVDYIRYHGQTINENHLRKDSVRAPHQQAALVISNNWLSVAKWDGTKAWEHNITGEDVMLTGPLLLYNHQYQRLVADGFTNGRNPRTAIGVTDKGRVLLITVDGRSGNSAGMSLPELAKITRWLHCKDAVNLDGGGSTTLWVKNSGVINYPSDNKRWDHEGQRKVANVVILKRD